MRLGCSALFLGLVAVVTCADVQSALAQGADDQVIPASHAYRYARYYVPYAIQSSAAYLPVNEMNDRRAKVDAEGYAMDAGYAVQTAVLAPDQKLTAHAKEAFRSWRYQFGSESYLTCIDPADSDCQASFNSRGWNFGGGPAFHVWARTRASSTGGDVCSEVSIAFRGTAGSQWDWISNLGRFGSPYDDYYHQLRRNVDGIIKLIQNLDCYKRARTKPQIVSTGHSLGGGLAQLAALANRSDRPRIAKVFAFDPSPVTGARLVDTRLRNANAQGLTIDRLYQEGEVLSYARSAVEEYPSAKSACNPIVRTVKVDAARGSALQLHGMTLLATNLVDLSYDGDRQFDYRPPPSPANCNIRYQAPASDQDNPMVASVADPRALLVAAARDRRSMNRLAAARREGARSATPAAKELRFANSFGMAVPDFTPLPRAE